MCREEKEELSLNTLIQTLKSTEKYSTNNKTANRCIRKVNNRASAVKNLYLQIFMKNMEQMVLRRAFWECKSQRQAMAQPTEVFSTPVFMWSKFTEAAACRAEPDPNHTSPPRSDCYNHHRFLKHNHTPCASTANKEQTSQLLEQRL